MSKIVGFLKSRVILNLRNAKQWLAGVAFAGAIMSSASGANIRTAWAVEPAFKGNIAFLAVQPISLEEKDGQNLVLRDNAFIAANMAMPIQRFAAATPLVSKSYHKISGGTVIVTAYSSTPDQTDDTPFITANGAYVYNGLIASNFLPFGAKVKFPAYSGDKVYTVEDRMAKKNSHKIDIWMETRAAALQFGVRKLVYEVVE